MNRLATPALNWETPIQRVFGQKPDISSLLQFRWFEPVYYLDEHHHHSYPSKSPEKKGRWVGVAETKGDALTYWILTDDTDQVIARSAVRSALDPDNPNPRADNPPSPGGEDGEPGDTNDIFATINSDTDLVGPSAKIKSTIDILPGKSINPG